MLLQLFAEQKNMLFPDLEHHEKQNLAQQMPKQLIFLKDNRVWTNTTFFFAEQHPEHAQGFSERNTQFAAQNAFEQTAVPQPVDLLNNLC